MITAAMSRRAEELATEGAPFVTATVVRAQRPTSVQAGNVALVLADGAIEGFVGGVCTEHSIRAYALRAMETGEAVLLRILPFDVGPGDPTPADFTDADGAVTVQNPCLSGGAVEVFLEPVLPAPRLLVCGDTPIAAAVRRLGAELGYAVADGEGLDPRPDDLGLVVAAHGRDELRTLRRGLESGVPYVGLVASPRRGTGVIAELRADGVPAAQAARIDVPAGLDIGARTPPEVALSILAKIVEVRREQPGPAAPPAPVAGSAPRMAVDPVCGMTVAAVEGTPSLTDGGETVYFCCEGCKAKYESRDERAAAAD